MKLLAGMGVREAPNPCGCVGVDDRSREHAVCVRRTYAFERDCLTGNDLYDSEERLVMRVEALEGASNCRVVSERRDAELDHSERVGRPGADYFKARHVYGPNA